ncbi:MAG: ABC transporter substrate-binding protein, partial [Spirochaetota bacterium]
MFDEYNLNPPKNWNEFLNLCSNLKKEGIIPISLGASDLNNLSRWIDYLNLRLNGIVYYRDFIEGNIPYTDENIVNIMKYIGELYNKAYFPSDIATYTSSEAKQLLFTKESALCLSSQDILNIRGNPELIKDLDYFKFPLIQNGVETNYESIKIEGLAVNQYAPNKESAEKFISFASLKENQTLFTANNNLLPANKKTVFKDGHSESLMSKILMTDGVTLGYKERANPVISKRMHEGILEYINNPENLDNILFFLEKDRRSILEGEDVSKLIKGDLSIYSYLTDTRLQNKFSEVINRFHTDNPYININIEYFAKNEIETNIETILNANNSPDIITIPTGNKFRSMNAKNLTAPLNDIFNGKFNKIYPEAFRNSCSHNDNIYILPFNYDWWSIYYNKTIFNRYNLSPPKNWEDFMGVCNVLRLRGVPPVALGTKDSDMILWWFDYINIKMNGIDFHRQLIKGEIPFTDEKVVNVFKQIRTMADKRYFIEDSSQYTEKEAATLIYKKDAGMYLSGQFIKKLVEAYLITRSVDKFSFPAYYSENQNKYEIANIDGFILNANSQNIEAGKYFLKYIMSIEVQQEFADITDDIILANKNLNYNNNDDAVKGKNLMTKADDIIPSFSVNANNNMASILNEKLNQFIESPHNLSNMIEELEAERQNIYE